MARVAPNAAAEGFGNVTVIVEKIADARDAGPDQAGFGILRVGRHAKEAAMLIIKKSRVPEYPAQRLLHRWMSCRSHHKQQHGPAGNGVERIIAVPVQNGRLEPRRGTAEIRLPWSRGKMLQTSPLHIALRREGHQISPYLQRTSRYPTIGCYLRFHLPHEEGCLFRIFTQPFKAS